jgi:hypothetical protein
MHRHALVDPGSLRGGMHGALELTGAERFDRLSPGNSQPPSSILPWARATRHQDKSKSSTASEPAAASLS